MSRFLISGGGTGGHVFPAIAIAQAIREKIPEARMLFVGAAGRMEMEKVPAAGFPIEGLDIAGFDRRELRKNLALPYKLAGSLLKARSVLRKFRPDVVIGVGGYASWPTLRMASRMRIPCLIQEQNSVPGMTNRLLARRVQVICVAYDGMEAFFPKKKILLTGNPVRKNILMLPARSAEVYRHFNLDPEKQTVLILGGSGGAQSVNEAVFSWIRNRIPSNIQLLWQTGNRYYQYYRSRLPGPAAADPTAPSSGFTVFPFIDQMDLAYTCADIIVSRSGAIAISEFCLVGKPVILVPSPNVAGDHQWENARALASREAALIVSDQEVSGKLPEAVVGLLGDPVRREQYGKNIRKLGIPDSADRIADQAIGLSLINKQKDGA